MTKILPGNSAAERRVHLERYVQAWLTSQAMTLDDLADQGVRDRLFKTLSGDLIPIIGRGVTSIALQLVQRGVAKLLDWGDETQGQKKRS